MTASALRIDLAGWSREATLGPSREFFAFFEEAERLGFDGAWFHEFRLLAEGGPYPSPLLLAAALLARTERLRIGVSALVVPLHHPLLLAEEIAQLGLQGDGRFDAGLGRGTDASTLRALEIDPQQTRERFAQGCRLVIAALRGESVSSSDGPWRFEAQQIRHLSTSAPPLYIAGSTEETMRFAVTEDLPLLLSLEPPEPAQLAHVEAAFAALDDEAVAPRRAAFLARSSLSRYVCIGATPVEARRQFDALLPLLHRRREHFAILRGQAPGTLAMRDPAEVLRSQAIVGDPASCLEQIQTLVARTGIRQLRCVFNGNGVIDRAVAMRGMRLFAQEVLPELKRG